MKYSLLDSNLKEKIAPILTEILNLEVNEIDLIYDEIKMATNEKGWPKDLNSELLCDSLIPYKEKFGLGIDFPIWLEWNTNKPKVMIIGRDPQRNHNDNRLIIGTPFGIGTKGGRETKMNKYWQFIEPLLETNRIYITDVYKLYTKDNSERKKLKKDSEFHYNILEKEISTINPNKIITIGKDAKIAVAKIYKKELDNHMNAKHNSYLEISNSLELFFIPHISNMVLQNFIPIANLFISIGKLKNNKTFEKIGIEILNEKENLFK